MNTVARWVGVILVAISSAEGVQGNAAPDVMPFSASLIGHWPLDEAAGATATETVGGRDGACRGGVLWREGRFGRAASFNGQDGSIALGDLGKHAEATISFWMRARDTSTDDFQGLVTSLSWGQGMLHLPIREGRIDAYLHLGGSSRARVKSPPLKTGRWTHVAVTVSALSDRMVLYIDGRQVAKAGADRLGDFDMRDMAVGYEGKKRYFDGEIDEILILARALSPAAIAHLAGHEAQPTEEDRLPGFPAEAEERLWRMRRGAPIKGSLVGTRGREAVLLVGEREVPVALAELTERDGQYARFLADEGLSLAHANSARTRDWRNILTGSRIPDEGYCDQPYIVVNPDGSWTCVMTTGAGHEGEGGQHCVATISRDQGETWAPLVDIEPADGPEASWIVPLLTPGGRIYGFYTYNGDRVYSLPGSDDYIRSDTHGWYCFKYSDDGGQTWSERHRLPMRVTACDRGSQFKGKVQMFWGIDKPSAVDGDVYFAFTKLGRHFLGEGEGWLYSSDNILTERDPDAIHWELRPDGDHGIRAPEIGSIQEEHNLVPLGGDRLYMVYRTTMGYPCHTYSEDGGKTWGRPEPMVYTPGGRTIRMPRACPKLWRCANGKYLFWYHHHGGRTFNDRNPAWISGGVLRNGRLHWSQPEVLLYEPNPRIRMSYPDLIEQDGRYWISETQKSIARVHEIPADLLEGLWQQHEADPSLAQGAVLSLTGADIVAGGSAVLPELSNLSLGGGFSLEVWLELKGLAAGQIILDSRDEDGAGFVLATGEDGAMTLAMSDGLRDASWTSDPGLLTEGQLHHAVFIADGGPCIISVVADGLLCDGGEDRKFGWGRFDPGFGAPWGGADLRLAPTLDGVLKQARIYDRYLRTSEAVGNFRVGCPDTP